MLRRFVFISLKAAISLAQRVFLRFSQTPFARRVSRCENDEIFSSKWPFLEGKWSNGLTPCHLTLNLRSNWNLDQKLKDFHRRRKSIGPLWKSPFLEFLKLKNTECSNVDSEIDLNFKHFFHQCKAICSNRLALMENEKLQKCNFVMQADPPSTWATCPFSTSRMNQNKKSYFHVIHLWVGKNE